MILTIVEHFSVYVTCILASLRKVEYGKSIEREFTLLKEEMIQQLFMIDCKSYITNNIIKYGYSYNLLNKYVLV